MRIRLRYLLLLALCGVLALGATVSASAQSAEEPKPSEGVAPQSVPPEVQEKAKTYKGSPAPPRDLKREADGHWTPYVMPEKPPEGAEVYTIQPGDTLSGLAQQKLGTWLLWPQIWDLNPYIRDAHWIYPGDPLFIQKPQVIQEEIPLTDQGGGPAETAPGETPSEEALQLEEEAPVPPVSEYDVYCSGFIQRDFQRPHLSVAGGPIPSRESLSKGDVIYLNEGKAEGLENGQQFFVIQEGARVVHPDTGKGLGRILRRTAQVRVVAAQEHASIAEVVQSCDAVRPGDSLVPYSPIPIPWNIEKSPQIPLELPPSDKPAGRVVWTEDRMESTGQHNTLYIDMGSERQLLPGDKVWFFRFPASQGSLTSAWKDLYRQQSVEVSEKDLFRPKKRAKSGDVAEARGTEGKDLGGEVLDLSAGDIGTIRRVLGEGVVLTTERETACVKVLSSLGEIGIGDRVLPQ